MNGISVSAGLIFLGFTLTYAFTDFRATFYESLTAMILYAFTILLNKRGYFSFSRVYFVIFNALLFFYYAIAHGEPDAAEYLLLCSSVSSMLFFKRLYTIALYFVFNMVIFFLAKFLFDYIEPFASHAGANLYIENHVFTFVGLFFIVFHFNKENQIKEEELDRRNAQNELLLKEIHHRVKNNLQILSSLLSLQSDSEQNEKVLGALQEGRNRVESMGLIHQRLYNHGTLSSIDMKEYVPELCEFLSDMVTNSHGDIFIESHVDDISVDVETAIPLGLIINELITNSIKYAKPINQELHIDVRLWLSEAVTLCLTVSDNGANSNQPIDETKSTNFGSQLISILSKKLKGKIEIDTSRGYATQIVFERFKLTPKSELDIYN